MTIEIPVHMQELADRYNGHSPMSRLIVKPYAKDGKIAFYYTYENNRLITMSEEDILRHINLFEFTEAVEIQEKVAKKHYYDLRNRILTVLSQSELDDFLSLSAPRA